MNLAVPGAVSGVILAFGFARFLKSLLFGVVPYDPITFVLVPSILMTTAVAAVSLPARRAALIDPVKVLRSE